MLKALLALNESDTHVFDSPEPGAAPRVYDSHVVVPDAHLLFNGEFKRVGTSDLKIVGDDGKSFFIPDYFAAEKRAALMSPEGATLSAQVVEALAGPLAPGQHAQAGGQAASAQPVIGRVDALTGSATVVRNGVSVALNIGDTVRKGDVVQTSGGSAVAIVFSDGTTFSLSANARMVLNDFIYNAGGAGNAAAISLVQGAFSFVAGQVAKTGDMRVETPVATMGIRGTAVLVEISASDGQTKFSVMVEPDGTTGSFNLYNKTTGALIGTVNNSQVGWVVTPAGPLQVVAQQVQKTPGELAQELGIVQQIFTIFNNNQQNPFTPPQQDQERRGDNQNDSNPQTTGSSGSGDVLNVTVPITTPDNPTPINVNVTITPVTDTTFVPPSGTPAPVLGSPPPTDPVIPTVPDAPTLNIIDFSNYVPPVPQINGTAGADQITGSNYNDVIDAGAGNDFVHASAGDDTIVAGHGEGNDFYDGGSNGEGGDTITFTSANGVVFNLNNGTFNLAGAGLVPSSTAQSATTGTDVFIRVEKIVASAGNDIFILHDTANWVIDAGEGIDIVRLANGIDFPDSENGPEISNWEIADLAIDTEENIVSFEVGDFDNIGDEGVILDRAPLRILGGANDIIQVTNHSGIEGYWEPAGTFVDPEGDGTEGDPFNDHFTDGVTFNIYQFVSGETVIGTVYIEEGVQIALPGAENDQASMAENEVLLVDVLANDALSTETTKTLQSLGSATIAGPEGVALGTPEILIQNNEIRIAPGTAFDALAEGETATITIPYTMQTGTGETFVATATVTVTGTNDAPYFTVLPENLEKLGVTGPGQIDGAGTLKLTSQGALVYQLDDFLGLTEASIADVNGGATNASAAAFDVVLVAGQTISFSWFFDADDYLPYNDFAFFSVALASDSAEKLSDVSVVRNYGDSGWQIMTFTAEESGLYRLGFGVANVGDMQLNSYLYIGGFTGIGFNLTAREDDAPQVFDLLYGAHDLDTNDVLSAINIALSGKDQSGNPIAVDGAVTIDGSNVSIDPTFFSSLSNGESVTVVVDYDLSDGQTTTHNTATLVINGADDEATVNQRPVLDEEASPALAAVNENAGAPVGAVGTLVSDLVDLTSTEGGLDNVSDLDANAVTGIALYITNTSNGTLYYSTDDGAHWSQVESVSDDYALLLAADENTRLYFQPNEGFSGTINDVVTFRAWDQTEGTNGQYFDIGSGGNNTNSVSGGWDYVGVTVNEAGGGNQPPQISVENAETTEGQDSTTLFGLEVTDADAGAEETFNITAVAQHGTLAMANVELNEGDQDESPSGLEFHATLAEINSALAHGITYTDPAPTQGGLIDMVTLTVTDANGGSDTINFIFNVFGDSNVDLTGTDGKDVLFGTGFNDNLTGGAGSDVFVFTPEDGSQHDIITDFVQGEDRIALYGFYNSFEDMVASGALDHPSLAQIDLGDGSSVTLQNFNAPLTTLTANDFIFHPSNLLVA